MISTDLHLHTYFSHGINTPFEMHAAASKKNLALIGFSEHSPRPDDYTYTHEYREQLIRHLPEYIAQVRALKKHAASRPESCQVLLGLEMDWLPAREDFVRKSCAAHDYDYIIGSVHFLDHWGFDDEVGPWLNISQEECEKRYVAYFTLWHSMLASGIFNIAAHPDLIKIYSIDQFHLWLEKPESRKLVRECLSSLRDSGMAMEVSSAGLRKPCGEIYPCEAIMQMAAELGLPISFASDAHNVRDVGSYFPDLEAYARKFGFTGHTVFNHGRTTVLKF